KLLKDLKELAEYDQSTSTDRPIFLNDNEDHPVQNRESPENYSEENVFLCIHDDVNDLIESALDSKLLSINSINSQCPDKKVQEVKNVEEQSAERRNLAPILNAKNLLPIPSECEVTLEDKREYDELVCDNHSDTFFDSKINDDISVYDDDFKDIEYIEASLLDPEIVSIEEENGVEEENVVQREEEEVVTKLRTSPIIPFWIIIRPNSKLFAIIRKRREVERLINLVENDNSDSSNDPLLEEVDLFLSDDSIPPGIENFADDLEGDIRFLEELLINDSILSHESFDSNFEDNPSNLRPPPEPPDDNFDLEPEVISAVMEDIDEPDEHFNPGGEIFVSTNIKDDYPPEIEVILCRIYVRFPRPSYPLIDFSLGTSIFVIFIAYSLFVPPLCSKF
nr:hypothetical protein [Tanacetum cinerariifolium]